MVLFKSQNALLHARDFFRPRTLVAQLIYERTRNMASSGINWRAPLHMGATTTEVPHCATVTVIPEPGSLHQFFIINITLEVVRICR